MHLEGSSDTTAGEAQGEVRISLKGGGSPLSLQLQAFMFPDQRSCRGNEVADTRAPILTAGLQAILVPLCSEIGIL